MTTLPLAPHHSTRFIPWITAAMMYLACLAAVGIALLYGYGRHVKETDQGHITLVIPLYQESQRDHLKKEVHKLLTPFMISQRFRAADEFASHLKELPTLSCSWPLILEGTLKNFRDLEAYTKIVKGTWPKAKVFSVHDMAQPLIHWVESLMAMAIFTVILILLLSGLVTFASTAITLHIHQSILELLDLLGANKKYILRQFYGLTLHHLKQALIIWCVLTLSTLALVFITSGVRAYILLSILGFFIPILLLGILTLFGIALFITTHLTVLRLLFPRTTG